ncbi:MAG: hypothetical protein ACLFV0_12100, partial [Nitriliruptoraceae bacterium]
MQPHTQDPTTQRSGSSDRPPGRVESAFRQVEGDPRYAWTYRRRNRLLLVAAQAGFLLLSFVLLVLERHLLALLAFLPFFPLMSFVNVAIHGLLDRPVDHLDDVMRSLRTEAKATAHTVLIAVIGALSVVLLVAEMVGGGLAEPFDVRSLTVLSTLAGLLLLAGLLPRWILASRL